MDAISKSHREFLRKPFYLYARNSNYSEGDVLKLRKYGCWLTALMLRELEPISEQQKIFISMCYGKAMPINDLMALWKRYRINEMYQVALGMEKKLGQSDGYPYERVKRYFGVLAAQGHGDALEWFRREGIAFTVPSVLPMIDIARIYPVALGKQELLETKSVVPGSYGSRAS